MLLGALMFFACAGLILASLDQILPELYDNAIVLGSLSFIVGMLYLIDLGDPLARKVPTTTQTDGGVVSNAAQQEKPQVTQTNTSVNTSPSGDGDNTWKGQTTISKDAQTGTDSLPTTPNVVHVSRTSTMRQQVMPPFEHHPPPNHHLMEGLHETDFVETKSYPHRQSPVFSKVKMGQERKPVKQKDSIGRNYVNRGFLEQWEEEEPVLVNKPPSSISPSRMSIRTRSPDLYHSSTYVQAPPVDKGTLSIIRKSKPVLYTYYPEFSTTIDEKEHEEEEQQPPPMRRGYVATAAAMWDSRVSQKSVHRHGGSMRRAGSQDTNV